MVDLRQRSTGSALFSQTNHGPLSCLNCECIFHSRRIPFAAPRSFDSPRVQFCRDLAKGCAPRPDLLDHWQHVLSMGQRPRLVHRCALARRLTLFRSPLRDGPASLTPRAFAAASAALVRSEIARPSCSATATMMCSTKRFASGISAAETSKPLSRRFAMKATLRARRSSLAMSNTAPARFASASARASSGRSDRLPLSTSTNSAMTSPRPMVISPLNAGGITPMTRLRTGCVREA